MLEWQKTWEKFTCRLWSKRMALALMTSSVSRLSPDKRFKNVPFCGWIFWGWSFQWLSGVLCQNEWLKKAGHVRTFQRWQRHSKYELQASRLFHNSYMFYTFICSAEFNRDSGRSNICLRSANGLMWIDTKREDMYIIINLQKNKITGQRLSQNVWLVLKWKRITQMWSLVVAHPEVSNFFPGMSLKMCFTTFRRNTVSDYKVIHECN